MSATNYRVLDATDRDVTDRENPPRTLNAARRLARFHGTGAVVLGARNQIVYEVKPKKEKAK